MESKFFDLKLLSDALGEVTYLIPDLDEIYSSSYGSSELTPCSGAIALLRSEKYPGYCQLFYSHRKLEEDGIIICTFYPAKTKDGDLIFVKYNKDHIFCIFYNAEKYNSSILPNKPSRIIIDSKWGV